MWGGIEVGEHVRIDDFCVLVGDIRIGSHVHIASHCGLHASQGSKIVLEDFSGISSNVQVYAASDDYDGEHITARPGIPNYMINTVISTVVLGKYSQIGTGSVVLPGGILGDGTAVGAMSLIKDNLKPWSVYVGVPCRFLKERKNQFLSRMEEMSDGRILFRK